MGNCYSGRLAENRQSSKWSQEFAIVPVPELPVELEELEDLSVRRAIDILPIELWTWIFLHFTGSTKQLLRCRLVCQDFKGFVDQLLQKEPLWTPGFPFISSLPLVFIGGSVEATIRRTMGTRISSAQKLDQFLLQMNEFSGNPFPNRKVLLYPNPDLCIPSSSPHRLLYKKIPVFLNRFGEHIQALEYCVRGGVKESVSNLQLIISERVLPNLQSLTLYTRDWNKRGVRQGLFQIYDEMFVVHSPEVDNPERIKPEGDMPEGDMSEVDKPEPDKPSPSLTYLQLMGSNGILPLNFLFGTVGKQLQSLYFCFMDDASKLGGIKWQEKKESQIDALTKQKLFYSLPEYAPNLIRLKVHELNEDLINKLLPSPKPTVAIEVDDDGRSEEREANQPAPDAKSVPVSEGMKLNQLQHISAKLQRPFVGPLNRLLKAIDEHCSESLESLHLEISRWPSSDNASLQREKSLKMNCKRKYPKLTELTIPYALYVLEPQFIFKFTRKCVILQNISFVSVNIHNAHFPDFDGFCKPLWGHLPDTVENITVRYWTESEKQAKQAREAAQENKFKLLEPLTTVFRSNRDQVLLEPSEKTLTCERPKKFGLARRHSWTTVAIGNNENALV